MKREKSQQQSSTKNKRTNDTNKKSPVKKKISPNEKSVWKVGTSDESDNEKRSGKKPVRRNTRTTDSGSSTTGKRKIIKKISTNEEEYPKRGDKRISKSATKSFGDKKRSSFSKEKPLKNNDVKKIITRIKKSDKKDEVRLNKFISNSGICSRREADELIEAGTITINGKVVTELGTKVKPTDDVRFNNQRLQGEQKVYILLNKPKGYVTTLEDPHADKTVMDLIEGACTERVYPVGRLDKNTTGVLLFTNDGELTKQLTHPSNEKMKVYHVFLDRNLAKTDLSKLVEGFTLEDGFIQADAAEYVGDSKAEVGLEIHSGRNRIVRRMFEHLGYKVNKLDRVYFAGLTKKGLKRGAWRKLNNKEVNMLKMGAFK